MALIVTDLPRDGDMIERLLTFKEFAEKAAKTAFVDHTPLPSDGASTSKSASQQYQATPNVDYGYAVRDQFQAGFSKRRNKPAELIAKYLDRAMRKGQKNATDVEFMTLLEWVLELYKFTEDRDVFRTYYMRALAKRLLLSRSANDAFEIAVLKKLTDGMNSITPSIDPYAKVTIFQNTISSSQKEKSCLRIWHFPVTWWPLTTKIYRRKESRRKAVKTARKPHLWCSRRHRGHSLQRTKTQIYRYM